MACIQIAVSTNQLRIALRLTEFIVCSVDPNGNEYGLIEGHWWYCDGTPTAPSCYTAAGQWGPCPWCWNGPFDCGRLIGDDGYRCTRGNRSFQCRTCNLPPDQCGVVSDVRGSLKDAGCCPLDPLTGLPLDTWPGDCEGKNGGKPRCESSVGNPINVATGNKFEEVLDLSISSPGIPMEFRRSYNSQITFNGSLGYGWTYNYDLSIGVVQLSPTMRVRVWDGDGKGLYFTQIQQTPTEILFQGESGTKDRLKKVVSTGQYVLNRKDGNLTYTFGSDGLLLTISDLNGNALTGRPSRRTSSPVTSTTARTTCGLSRMAMATRPSTGTTTSGEGSRLSLPIQEPQPTSMTKPEISFRRPMPGGRWSTSSTMP